MTPTAIVTGAGSGFGLALTLALASRGDHVVAVARDGTRLHTALAGVPGVTLHTGDVTDPGLGPPLLVAVGGRLDLLVHNAGELGPSPLPHLADYPVSALRQVLETTVVGPLQLTQALLPALRAAHGTIVTLSSDAAVEPYEGWGGYGLAKAAADHAAAVLAVEEPDLRVYAFDPGDMRTAMHQRAFPGEDISDRPDPATVVPALLRLLESRPTSGRYTAELVTS
ncbi:SDR family NAD(P)-dependent oxidoreductase [Pseudonocardia pini]|uniref:SDR family NAD(P)-dependent oxidoreductase n=1 Tax=Pseudonocardia pini TaxID=2758030 RepID=UPI0015F0169A|nr:SDR family NAD(P)-dependent oxidoreductase [Pseudonocardia pini]